MTKEEAITLLCEHFSEGLVRTIVEALKQEQDEPVAYINVEQRKLEWAKYIFWETPTVVNLPKIPLYTYSKEWVGLTNEQIVDLVIKNAGFPTKLAEEIEAKLKEKNAL